MTNKLHKMFYLTSIPPPTQLFIYLISIMIKKENANHLFDVLASHTHLIKY